MTIAMSYDFRPGDPVIYRATKHSAHPGPRAQDVTAETNGEGYSYVVDKFWVVMERQPNGQLVLRTRRGKTHQLAADDPRLRPARWWERLWFRGRFPSVGMQPDSNPTDRTQSSAPNKKGTSGRNRIGKI